MAHIDLDSLLLLLPGMVRVRNEHGPNNDDKGPSMRFNWYDLGKTLIGYAIASVVVVLAMRGEIQTLKEVHIQQHIALNATIERITRQLDETASILHSVKQEQASRSDAVQWARQRMQNGR